MIVRRIAPLSLARIVGLLYAIIGILAGGLVALFSLFGAAIGAANESGGAFISGLFGIGAIFFMPVLYGVLGFVGGLLVGWLYNVVAPVVGGLELTLE
ncbi:MAG: hypothetical protein PVF43_07820 [Candidatus Eiseniibacteriota bacterium]|jgi:hypothetical protein